jgi:2-oxoglutarate dehydrogenase E1 component
MEYKPLNHITRGQAKIEARDSLLSEAAVLGFEYGYSTADPLALVLWEAQFGDFANGAQVIIDNFIVASYEKWKLPNGIVMLLPHGFEGQGSEHSSARLERFLILCAQDNMQVCNVTTPAQYFHLLRRQIKHKMMKPLIIMTPKSLLRLPDAKSLKDEFTTGRFREVIDDNSIQIKDTVDNIIFSSGKVYYDLLKYRTEHDINDAALVRVEQLYPYKSGDVRKILSSYVKAKKVVWVQEEPKNMGAWNYIAPKLIDDLAEGQRLRYSGRPESASPAVGSQKISNRQQKELVEGAFQL